MPIDKSKWRIAETTQDEVVDLKGNRHTWAEFIIEPPSVPMTLFKVPMDTPAYPYAKMLTTMLVQALNQYQWKLEPMKEDDHDM